MCIRDSNVNTEGPPAAVFALLADGSTWPRWSPIDAFELEAPGAGDPEGVGAIRVFTTGRHVSRERVVTVPVSYTHLDVYKRQDL